jgi:pyrroline-5-carboxylate reductase
MKSRRSFPLETITLQKKQMKIAVLGCGNLGKSIINGILSSNKISAENISATKRNTVLLSEFETKGVKTGSDNVQAIKNAELIFVAVKPYDVKVIFEEIADFIDPKKQIIICLATGITIAEIQSFYKRESSLTIFRAMPNTAADIAQSMTCVSSNCSDEKLTTKVKEIFDSIGNTIFIKEELMESATVLASCGIAFVLRFMRSMVQGGIQIGFDSKTASEIVNHVVKGAAQLLIDGGQHPEFEIDKVTTPKGCTIVGLNEMEHNGFSSSLIKGISASYKEIEK